MITFIIIAAVVLILIVAFISMYNSLVHKRNEADNVFGGIDVQLKKRYDLIPNLISTVKQYTAHEKGLLTQITEMRAKSTNNQLSNDEKVALDNQISSNMHKIMVAVYRAKF